ncbi:MAG: type II toxin-antitoxin system prevent-host-death family antitoxin [Mycolicibacter sinensis]
MAMVNIHEAKTHLSSLLARVENGETITPAGRSPMTPHSRVDIAFGALSGRLHYDDEHRDDVDDALNAQFGIECPASCSIPTYCSGRWTTVHVWVTGRALE